MTQQSGERWRAVLAVVTVAILLGAAVSLVVAAPVVVQFTQAHCDTSNSTCGNCVIDYGGGNPPTACWATTCDDEDLGYRVCIAGSAGPISVCQSDGAINHQCYNCKSWRCDDMHPAAPPSHPYPYCDIGDCKCPDRQADLTVNWSIWPVCTA